MFMIPIIIGNIVPAPEQWSLLEDLQEMFLALFEILDYEISAGGVSFSLMDVFFAGGILTIFGGVIGLLFVWTQKRR